MLFHCFFYCFLSVDSHISKIKLSIFSCHKWDWFFTMREAPAEARSCFFSCCPTSSMCSTPGFVHCHPSSWNLPNGSICAWTSLAELKNPLCKCAVWVCLLGPAQSHTRHPQWFPVGLVGPGGALQECSSGPQDIGAWIRRKRSFKRLELLQSWGVQGVPLPANKYGSLLAGWSMGEEGKRCPPKSCAGRGTFCSCWAFQESPKDRSHWGRGSWVSVGSCAGCQCIHWPPSARPPLPPPPWLAGGCLPIPPGIWKDSGLGFTGMESSLSGISAQGHSLAHQTLHGLGWVITWLFISCTFSLCCLRQLVDKIPISHGVYSLLLWERVGFLTIKCSLTFSLPLLLICLQEEIILASRAEGYSVRESLSCTLPVFQPKS